MKTTKEPQSIVQHCDCGSVPSRACRDNCCQMGLRAFGPFRGWSIEGASGKRLHKHSCITNRRAEGGGSSHLSSWTLAVGADSLLGALHLLEVHLPCAVLAKVGCPALHNCAHCITVGLAKSCCVGQARW